MFKLLKAVVNVLGIFFTRLSGCKCSCCESDCVMKDTTIVNV